MAKTAVWDILTIESDVVPGKWKNEEFFWLSHENLLTDFLDEQLTRAWKDLTDKERLMLNLIDIE